METLIAHANMGLVASDLLYENIEVMKGTGEFYAFLENGEATALLNNINNTLVCIPDAPIPTLTKHLQPTNTFVVTPYELNKLVQMFVY